MANKLRLYWDPEYGGAYPEGKVPEKVKLIIDRYRKHWSQGDNAVDVAIAIGQDTLLNEYRLAVKRGLLKPEEVCVVVDGVELTINKQGRLSDWPLSLCRLMDDQLMELIGWNKEKNTPERASD